MGILTEAESKIFIETMEEIGDVWTVDQVMGVYGDYSLQDAINARRASLTEFMNIISTVLNR